MSKQFVTFDQFRSEIKSLKNDIQTLGFAYEHSVPGKNWKETIDNVEDNMSALKEAININADGCQELESRLDEVTKRLDKLSGALRRAQTAIEEKNSNGVAVALLVGLAGFAGFIYLAGEINKLAAMIDEIEEKKKESQRVVTEKPAPEVTFHEDGTYDTKSSNKEA